MADFERSRRWNDDADVAPSPTERLSVTVVAIVLDAVFPPNESLQGSEPAMLTIVHLPSEDWIDPAKDVLERRADATVDVLRPSRRGTFTVDTVELLDSVAQGKSTTIVLHGSPPSSLMRIADAVIEVPRSIPRSLVAEVLSKVASGEIDEHEIPAAKIDLGTLLAAVRPGRTVAACAARLTALAANNADVDRPEVPMLDQIIGYGVAATDWAKLAAGDLSLALTGQTEQKLESAIFYGPPGTGKTTLANVIAKSAGVRLVSTSTGAWFRRGEGALGDVIASIEEFLTDVRANAPCVAFIDECDGLPSRDGMTPRGREWWGSVVARVLLGVEEIRRFTPPVLLLGATNDIAALDPALIRSGRFDRKISIPAPTTEELAEILHELTGGVFQMEDLIHVASFKPSATGADARAWVGAAAREARLRGRDMSIADLIGQVRQVDERTDFERRAAAIHEAGHLTVALALGATVARASILFDPHYGGDVNVDAERITTRDVVDRYVRIALGGRAADMVFGTGSNAGAASDLAKATHIAASARINWGLGDRLMHAGEDMIGRLLLSDRALAEQVEADLSSALVDAKAIVSDRGRLVFAFADALLARDVLGRAEIEEIAGQCGGDLQTELGDTRSVGPHAHMLH